MTSPFRSLWRMPAASPLPPRRVWRDWALVAGLPVAIMFEAAVRPDLADRWIWAIVLIALVPVLLWRRTHPFTVFAVSFATSTVVEIATGGQPELFTTAFFLVLIYSLVRWGSGRALLGGAALIAAGTATSIPWSTNVAEDLIGAVVVVIVFGSLGWAVRARATARDRELETAKSLEREQLARDLHDTVAHHVSAIVIQAQAGRAVAAHNPAAAVSVLESIETEGAQTLEEMRAIVRVLRGDDSGALAPSPGFGELRELERSPMGGPTVSVMVTGPAYTVPPFVAAAVFRMSQEAVTNARRHGKGVTRIDVAAEIAESGIRMTVTNDGETAHLTGGGFGIIGMRERAALLGGTLDAGPTPGGGWTVAAVLPRAGWTP